MLLLLLSSTLLVFFVAYLRFEYSLYIHAGVLEFSFIVSNEHILGEKNRSKFHVYQETPSTALKLNYSRLLLMFL